MKKLSIILCALLVGTAAFASPDVDTITAASGSSYYKNSSYDLQDLKDALGGYPYPTAISVATVNADGSPNISVVIPGLSADGRYPTFGLAGNRTRAVRLLSDTSATMRTRDSTLRPETKSRPSLWRL